ncbi:helix-turn-helix transcriptional regulator [Thermaerobacter sp. PB12/4term]|uniref:helix-turn-helix domain-containing protein n=1 Tax=Thermaerobacter sp. PB12/4term TaxID=2293838 RepID=UPI000E32A17F|nr:helix-turn-helix transcriptional regulator [Thermaerobacter sp. PB12/4term]QIA28004.1 helix-turn-helix transcriptional regulator [Thermaerobacter sp. PB12/4term]
MDDLGGRLRRIRESRNLSIYEVERRTGMHFSTISKYERNERQPSLDVLRELAALYEVPVSVFLTDRLALETLLPQPLAGLALQLLDRPALAEACQRLATLEDQQLEAVAEFLDRVGLTGRGRGTTGGRRRGGTLYPRPRGGPRLSGDSRSLAPSGPEAHGAPEADTAAEAEPAEAAPGAGQPSPPGAPPPPPGGPAPGGMPGGSSPGGAPGEEPGPSG